MTALRLCSRTPEAPSTIQRLMSLLRSAASVALNFVREGTPESCTRLCALLCCITGCACALATFAFAFLNPGQTATALALGGQTTALIGGGTVAIIVRKRKPDGSHPEPDSSHSEQSEESAVAVSPAGAA